MIGNTFTLKQLEALIWVADLGSFRKAAAHLNTTQPNISARIAGIEATLGVTLMLRNAGSVQLTDKGTEIVQAARRVLHEAEGLITVAKRPDLIQDRLRLGVTELVACTWLHSFLLSLKDAYPSVSVELTVDLSRNLDIALTKNAVDLAIQTAPFSSNATGITELGQYPYIWVCGASLTFEEGQQYGIGDLLEAGILTPARDTQASIALNEYADRQGLPKGRIVPSNSLSSCVKMARDGLGVAVLPRALVTAEAGGAPLRQLRVDWTPAPLRFAARYQAGKVARYVEVAAAIAGQISKDYIAREAEAVIL
ncbi:LysR family transcriptional regulator [Sulfitobacter sp. M368]|uniref:LysR family transcriptional regulator n=1 Tax=Sulfitobacter sp. M368 TaxID=2867021 RepID=UPI0021A8330A|nr:LysR family transcriptional regulator [Sulfitobacter sp. M368]UWR14806.1 LysR family transcriptional regulator [Sulfitobacter sp. M368]